MSEKIILHRKDSNDWIFTWDGLYGGFTHVSRYGTIYKVFFPNPSISKEIWIGRLFEGVCRSWGTVEREIRAESIEMRNVIINFL